jgi:hypothetical protein
VTYPFDGAADMFAGTVPITGTNMFMVLSLLTVNCLLRV